MSSRTILVSVITSCCLFTAVAWSAAPASAAVRPLRLGGSPAAPVTPMPMGRGCGSGHLAQTGVTVGGLLIIAAALLVAGIASLRLGRRVAIPAA